MKQFNLQEYLEDPYRKIVTRDGRSIRIICTNRMNSKYPVVVLIREGNKEVLECYTKDGKFIPNQDYNQDLFFASVKKKADCINMSEIGEDNNANGRQWLREYNSDGTNAYGEVEILHKATPMNEEYLLSKGFLKDSDVDSDDDFDYSFDSETFISSNRQIMVQRYQVAKAFPYGWFMLVKNRDMEDIGSLDFIYIEQFESFLKLCGVE